MTATTAPDADALRTIGRVRDLTAALATHGTAYSQMAHERRRLVAALRAAGILAATIADLAGVTPSTVRQLDHRARRIGDEPTP